MDSTTCGTLGKVLPGSLLGPIVGLTFSTDGGLLFAVSGSTLWVYDVGSGALLSTVRVFMLGVAVYGMDVGRESFGAIFGEKCVRVVDAVPTCAYTAHPSAWFQGVVHLPDLDDRVWDARLVDSHGGPEGASSDPTTGDMEGLEGDKQLRCQEEERKQEARRRGRRAGMGLLAVALAHNSVEVWDWVSQARPFRMLRTRGGDPCLLYHARLWGRTLDELRVAAGTVFNQVLVWNPRQVGTTESKDDSPRLETRGREAGRTDVRPRRDCRVLRLKGHEGVIFRVAWREDGRRLVSSSDDRTVRVWSVDCSGGGGGSSEGEGTGNEGHAYGGQLLWTGWGHASRVWDVGFTRLGVVTCGEDGAAILWKGQSVNKSADTVAEAAAAGTVSAKQLAAKMPPYATARRTQLHGQREGGQLVPVATMRGHSGVNTWRLAVHEFDSRRGAGGSSCDELNSAAATENRREERGRDRRGLTLMATGGNDGTCKLWDLEFEGACERRQRWEKRRNGALWGQTEPIPTEHVTASRVSPDTVLVGDKSRAVETHEDGHPTTASTNTHTRLAASAVTPAADRNENSPETVAATAVGEPKGNPTEPERTSGNSSKQDEREGLEQSGGRASGRRGVRQRQKKTAVVREVKLAPASKSGTAAAAAVLLTDGSLWWVPDLQVGTWERVTVSVGDAAVADGVTETDFLSSASLSAIAVVGLSPGDHHPGGKKTTASDGGGESVGGKIDGSDRGSGDEVAIVAGRDDGWLMLLSQSLSRPAVDADGRKRRRPPSQPRAWCVRAAWKGHRSRVTAAWAVSDAAQRRSSHSSAGESQAFSAALETSRLSKGCAGGGFDGVLVSAGSDGTVAWWEWACAEESQNMVHTRDPGDMAIPAPRLRMVCQAAPGAAVTSVAIDDRRQPRHRSSQKTNHGGRVTTACTDTPNELEGHEDDPSAGAVIFCGDTKGNIQCFLEGPTSEGCVDGGRDEEAPAAGRAGKGLRDALQPCLVLKRQHGKDQVSRIALRGGCLFSAGHDGQVNHYMVSYSASSPGMPANAEPRHTGSAAIPARHASGECTVPSFPAETVDLTIVTTYATAPVTTVSELWVGGEGNWEAEPRQGAGGSEDRVRVAVAGRSGSSRMSVWDLTEGRQILELACGEKHLAQDLVLSWPSTPIDDGSGCSLSDLDRGKIPSTAATATVSKTDDNMHDSDGDGKSITGGTPSLDPRAAQLLLVLPHHTFIFAEPFSSAEGTNISSKSDHIAAGKEAIAGTDGSSCPESSTGPRAALAGEAKEHRRQQQSQGKRQQRFGLALAFHSSFFPLQIRGDHPEIPLAAAENVADSPAAGLGSASVTASAVTVPAHQPTAAAEKTMRKEDKKGVAAAKDDRESSPFDPKGVRRGSFETSNGGGGGAPVSQVPGRFGYSLGKPFHSQRVASVKFVIPGAQTESLEAGQGGFPSSLRLVTGGEDGAVKLLDVFCERPRRSSNPQAVTDPASETFHCPYTTVVQTLPSHESSVGALAVGLYRDINGLESTLIVSGGGKMEARSWCMEGACGPGGNHEGAPREEVFEAACAPPVRWLATTTPAPKSPLHGHRIMCLCALPPPTSQSRLPSGQDKCRGDSIFVAGDSGGGVTVFQLRRDAAATGSTAVGGTVAAVAAASAGRREARSRPAGRWMTSGERPVLSLAHARVPPSAAPNAALDFVVTGDTGGTVTVWEFLPEGGSGVLVPMDEGNCRGGASGVEGGFVHRGPAGKRRSGSGMSADGAAAGEPPPRPGLVPVLSYRAHQMGVLCMAVHVPSEGERMVIVTGGDDQAICVAEVELHECDYSMKPFDEGSPQGRKTSCLDEKTSAGERRLAVRLVEGRPEVTNGAAGSAIKGISMVPKNGPSASSQAYRGVDSHLEVGERTRRSPIALSVFTISRDQRLSRWHLTEEDKQDNCTPVGGTEGPHSLDSRVHADGSESSSSPGLGLDESDHARRCSGGGGIACDRNLTATSHQGSSDGLRQRARQDKKEERRHWRLRWRAGCVTDVADISGLGVYALPGDPNQHAAGETAAFCALGSSTIDGATSEENCGRNAAGEAHVYPAALVAVSGQGLQLVLFGAC